MIKLNFLNTFQKKIDKLDIETIKNILYELIEENENLKNLFNSMKEAVLVLDKKMNISFYNKMAIRILDIAGKNLIGININDILKNEYLKKIINDAILKEEILEEIEIKLDNENQKFISFSMQPFVKNGTIIGNIIIIDDISIEKENKNKLRQAESLAALTTISAGIAHEIKNNKPDLSNDFKLSINVIKEEIERLNRIVIDYLTTVRPLKAKLTLVNLKEFLDKFIELIQPELESNGIKLEKKYSKLPEVWIDEKYFKQALINLINNSLSAIKKNGIIKISVYQKHNYVILNIIDNGEGIPEEIQSKIFDPYFTTKSYGTGLGLTIVYKIIKEHRGEISFTSKKGETVFSIKLPLSFIEKGLIEYSGEFK